MKVRQASAGAITRSAAAVASILAYLVSGCEGSTGPSTARPDSAPVCPATAEETIGAACAVPGLTCGPEYTCGLTRATFVCVCSRGKFQCTDGFGDSLGAPPACPSPSKVATCPAGEPSGLAPCGSVGLVCDYPAACRAQRDVCQCFPGATADGGFGLRFECPPVPCLSGDAGKSDGSASHDSGALADTGVVTDAGTYADATLGSGADAGSSAHVESGAGADAAPDVEIAVDGAGPKDAADGGGDAPAG